MDKNKFSKKLKDGVSVQEIENFARKHMTEVFTVLALAIATISSAWGFFTGAKLTLFVLAIGTILGVFFPVPVERGLKQLYSFTFKQEKPTQIVLGAVKVLIAIFVPFVFFGFVGLLAGTAYHYYTRNAQTIKENTSPKAHRSSSGEEHD